MSSPNPAVPRVLIVDDNADTAEMYGLALSFAGFETVEASDVGAALRSLSETPPAVVVTDLDLPGGIDGIAFTRLLRTDPSTHDLGIIMVSGFCQAAYRSAAHQAGCDIFLEKPCPPDELIEQVGRLIASRGHAEAAVPSGDSARHSGPSGSISHAPA